MFDPLGPDLRYAWRIARRTPVVTAVALVSLALGVGANTAIFTLIDTLMLRPLPVRAPAELVELLSTFPNEPRINGFPWKVYEYFRDSNRTFSSVMAVAPTRFRVAIGHGDADIVLGDYVSGNVFESLGLQPAAGRLIRPDDDRPGSASAAVAVLSWRSWRSRFNADPSVIGMPIVVDGVAAAIIGVAPESFTGVLVGYRPEIWLPAAMETLTQKPSRRADATLGVGILARLKPGVTIEQARADAAVLNRWRVDDVARTRQSTNFNRLGLDVEPAASGVSTLRERFARPLVVLMAVVGVLLLIACTNVASVLIARGSARHGEMAVRVALGASRARIVRQVMSEAVILSAAGTALGVVLAYAGARALVRIVVSGRPLIGVPGVLDVPIQPDARVLLFTAAVAVATTLLFGLAPAFYAAAAPPIASLREAATTGENRSRRMFGMALVATQVALSMVLLMTASLFLRHLSRLRNDDLGFERRSVVLVRLDSAGSGYAGPQLTHAYRDLLQRFSALPGVRAATISAVTPVEGPGAARPVNVEGSAEPRERRPFVMLNWIGPRYFETLATPLFEGRDFSFEDEGRPRVAIVNRSMARHYFGDDSAIGHRFTFDGSPTTYDIVGVVGDAKYLDLSNSPPTIYLNAFQEARMIAQQFSLRTSVAPATVAAGARRVVADALKTVRVAKVTTLEEQVDASIVPERLIATLAAWFGGLGALLAAIGLYGLMAFTVSRRTNEIGVRIALGATTRDIIAMVLRSAMGLVIAGIVVGVPLAIGATRIAARLMVGLSPAAVWPLSSAALAMTLVALLAAGVPAIRASRVRPTDALRHL